MWQVFGFVHLAGSTDVSHQPVGAGRAAGQSGQHPVHPKPVGDIPQDPDDHDSEDSTNSKHKQSNPCQIHRQTPRSQISLDQAWMSQEPLKYILCPVQYVK